MPINITSVGGPGGHSLARVNVNVDDDFIYFKNVAPNVIPSVLIPGSTFIYTSAIGSLEGVTEEALLYVTTTEPKKLTFSLTAGGASVNITGSNPGSIKFNTPVVYDNQLNIDASTATNQAVKYFTNQDPLTGLVSGNTYFLKNVSISGFAGSQALYAFTSHSFTTCGQTGRLGPTITQMRSAYTVAGNWDDTYLQQGAFPGYQDWTVPVSGVYRFRAAGASGYQHPSTSGTFGRGAIVEGEIALTKGEIITFAVGQQGNAPTGGGTFGGSGGGTFVVRKTGTQPLFVAGGGTGETGNVANGRDGSLTTLGGTSTNGQIAGGAAGFGGRSTSPNGNSAAGGGFFSRGENRTTFGFNSGTQFGGGAFNDGLTMGTNARAGGYGGFGGGGQADSNQLGQAGGAGGYSGGGGARSTIAGHSGGGGGSFIVATAANVKTSTGLFDSIATFNGAAITNLNSFNTGEGSVDVTLVSSFTTGNEVYPTALDAENGTNRILIEADGSSTHAFVPINFDIQNDLIHSPAPHTLADGEAVIYNFNGVAPLGISNETVYYINTVNAFSYRISSTPGPTFTTINLLTPSSLETGSTSRVSRVIVNAATDTLTINNHGFLVDQPLKYDSGGGAPIGGLVNGVTFYVAQVLNANQITLKSSLLAPTIIDLTGPGTGTSHSFIFLTVNGAEDTLYIPNHGLVDGQTVIYSSGGGGNVVIPGLSDGNTYFIRKIDNSIVRLATNPQLTIFANIGEPDPWTATGTHSLTIQSLNFALDTISVPGHGFLQGELVEYDSRGQTAVAGLTTATPYYVIYVNGDELKLALTPEDAENGVAVDLQASPAGVGRHTLRSLSKTPDGIYEILATPTATTFTAEAKGSVPEITKTFNPRTSLDLATNSFLIPSHGFLTGTRVTYSQGDSATDISGLVDDTDYFVVATNRDYLRLASTADNAASGVTLPITDFGTGVGHSLTTNQINGNVTGAGSVSVGAGSVLVNGVGTQFSKIIKVGDRFRLFPPNTTTSITFAAADVNTTTNRITKAHTFTTGQSVKFSVNGGVAPAPLIDGYYYFARSISSTEITLHNSIADANNNIGAVDFSTQGTGTSFTLTNTVPVSPIIRRITAIGSDTQITVDRPYANQYTAVSYSYPTFIYVRPQGYSLHRPFDGGVEMSVGAGTSLGSIVRQTRKYFRYQSGKGIQTSCGINFKPSIDIESMTQFSSTTVECKTRRPHGLISGLSVIVSQATDSFGDPSTVYNGEFVVTVPLDDLTTFRFSPATPIVENKAYGFPQFFVKSWSNGAVRSGMFDDQNGMFFEYDGQKLYAVRRSSTQQIAGTISAQQGSELIFGTNTAFDAQLEVGDYVVLRGQSYRITQIDSSTRMSVRPEYKGSSGVEREFDPAASVVTASDTINITGHGFSHLLPVAYNSIDGEPIGGLINGRTYYVDTESIALGSRNNSFKLYADPDASTNVNLSSAGTTNLHSFTPAKSGIVATRTVDTRVAQEDFSIDPLDGSGITGYNLDLSRIQMAYIDYSWYGAGKIRFGFKTTDGQVQYCHEFVHNNNLYESYLRSGNLPGRYEVVTYNNPTYIPYLFHWGTSVMMDGGFDDDNAYLFTAGSQTLDVRGTTSKVFAGEGINLANDLITVQSHGFRSGDLLQFQSIATNGFPGDNASNPATRVVGSNTKATLENTTLYGVLVNSVNLIHLTPPNVTISSVDTTSQAGQTVSVTTRANHNLTTGMYVGVYGLTRVPNGPRTVTVTSPTAFTYTVPLGPGVVVNITNTILTANVATITTSGAHGFIVGQEIVIAGANNAVYNGTYTITAVPTVNTFRYARTNANIATAVSSGTVSINIESGPDVDAVAAEVIDFETRGNTQFTYFLYPNGSLNNTSGPNYTPLLSIRLSPSVSEGLTGKLGDRDVLNRMQLRLQEIGLSTTELLDVKVLLNPRLNNLNFVGVDSPSLTQVVEHTAQDTVSGGIQIYNFRASGGSSGSEGTTVVNISTLFELSNSILGGDSIFPDGPDILTIAVSRLTGNNTLASAKLSWSEAQA
jgi:hypothetical protein